jgi:hypothetical protein
MTTPMPGERALAAEPRDRSRSRASGHCSPSFGCPKKRHPDHQRQLSSSTGEALVRTGGTLTMNDAVRDGTAGRGRTPARLPYRIADALRSPRDLRCLPCGRQKCHRHHHVYTDGT